MYKVAVCIPTYKRPELLTNLIVSINNSYLPDALFSEIFIIVVDNDSNRTAEIPVSELKELARHPIRIEYFNYPKKGLANVRNELLNKSLGLNPDFLALVDDDEQVSKEWLHELLKTYLLNKGDIIMGPVIYVLQNNVSKYVSCWFERPDHHDNRKLDYVNTGNVLINVKSLTDRDVFFDPRFNHTGGEDSYFGLQMIKKGAAIFWSANAKVYEAISDRRATLLWLIRRSYNSAINYTRILKIEKNYTGIVKKMLTSILYLFSGTVALVMLPLPIKRKYWGLLRISESIGSFAGIAGVQFRAYS